MMKLNHGVQKVRKNATISVIVAVTCMSVFCILSGCIFPRYWDGWVGREVVVTVFDKNSNNPVSSATVTLQNLHLPKKPPNELKVNATTGPDGIAKLFAYFPGSGKRGFLTEEGGFGLVGTLEVSAEEYSTETEPLSSLVGKDLIPIGDKSAIHVRVDLRRKD